ncbi:MAG: Gldg family protein [Crocosphaera sp.]|nr:Gldg family protein [Crocosphaera sp.]
MKKLSNYKTIIKYLFIPGFILTVAGLLPIFITQTQSILYLSLAIAGGICLFIWLVYILVTGRSFWQKRSTQTGTNALISTLSLVVILALINFIAVRYSPRIDLTENQLYTLSPETQQLVKSLQQPTTIYIFDKDITPQDEDLLENYQRYSNNFKYEVVDPDIRVGLTQQFDVQSLGDVYLEYGDKKQLVQTLIAFNQREPLSEIKLTNAIEKIQKEYIPKIYVLQGHGEYSIEPSPEGSLSQATNSLQSKGYEVNPLNIVENSGIPDNADVLILASPKRQLFEQEVTTLQQYLDKGGNLFLLLDPNTDPGLEPILKDWGIKLDNRIIIDGSGAGNIVGLGPTTPFITNYGNHPITEEFTNSISFYPLSRPVDTVEVENVEATSLLVTSEQMWAESNLESEEVIFDPQEDIPGPFDLGVALTRTITQETVNTQTKKDDNTEPINQNELKDSNNNQVNEEPENQDQSENNQIEDNNNKNDSEQVEVNKQEIVNSNNSNNKTMESRLVVIGNSTFATNDLFNQQLNGDVFLNSVQWLSNQDKETLSIRPKEAKDRRLNLSPSQVNIITILSLGVFPLLGLVAAGITWWRRR